MRLVSINVVDIGAEAADGDRVLVRSTMTRASSTDPTRIVTPAEITVPLIDGQATIELDPGPVDVTFRCRNIKGGGPYHINVPEGTGTVHLADLLKQHYPYDPPVVNAAYQYSLDAAASAAAAATSVTSADASKTAAATSATNAASSSTSANTSKNAASTSATNAAASATNAATSASSAAASEADAEEAAAAAIAAAWSFDGFTPAQVSDAALRAEDAAVRAEGVADTFGSLEGVADQVQVASDAASSASGSATSAASSASAAATSESNAADSAASAGTSASSAASSASAAAGSASAAAGAADTAAGSESQAASSASAAASSASVADSAATRAEAVADSTHWQDDRLSVMGQLGPSLTGPKGDKGAPGDGSGDVMWAEIGPIFSSKADLVGGQVPTSQIPAVALTKPHQVNSLAEMLALPTEEGDVAVITSGDWKGTYMLGGGAADVAASWIRLSGPDAPVQSVNGQSGTVVLGHADVGAAPASHTHPAASISDATTVGLAVLTSADAATARGAIGAGTSDLALGTTSSTAKAGNYQPTAANISDATTVGRNVLKASDAAAARAAIGAGTSSLALGTTSATAAAGNHTHSGYATTAQVNAKVTGVGITAIEVVTVMPSTPNSTTLYVVKAS